MRSDFFPVVTSRVRSPRWQNQGYLNSSGSPGSLGWTWKKEHFPPHYVFLLHVWCISKLDLMLAPAEGSGAGTERHWASWGSQSLEETQGVEGGQK